LVHCPETYSYDDDDEDDEEEDEDEDDDDDDNEDEDEDEDADEDDEEDEDDVIITFGLQHSLKIRNYASDSSYHNATNNYDNNDDDASSSSDHSTVGDHSGGVSNDDYEDNDDDAKDANHEANNNDATLSKEDYTSLSSTNQSFQPNVSASESSSFIGPVAIPNGMPTRKSRVTTLGRNHPMVKMGVPFPMNVYLVLVVAVDPLFQDLICLNQLPSHLSMVLVGNRS
jgi:hypothetical protein